MHLRVEAVTVACECRNELAGIVVAKRFLARDLSIVAGHPQFTISHNVVRLPGMSDPI